MRERKGREREKGRERKRRRFRGPEWFGEIDCEKMRERKK